MKAITVLKKGPALDKELRNILATQGEEQNTDLDLLEADVDSWLDDVHEQTRQLLNFPSPRIHNELFSPKHNKRKGFTRLPVLRAKQKVTAKIHNY